MLQRLELHGSYEPASCDVLASLPALRCLLLLRCWAPLPCLPRLTALTALAMRQDGDLHDLQEDPVEVYEQEWQQAKLQAIADTRAFLAGGLTQLHQLAALRLYVARSLPITALPADLGARLPGLQRLEWVGDGEDGRLPAGLTGLQQLALPAAVALRSAAQLAAAPGLECLTLDNACRSRPRDKLCSQVAFVAQLLPQLPALRRLRLCRLSSFDCRQLGELRALLPSIELLPSERYQFGQFP